MTGYRSTTVNRGPVIVLDRCNGDGETVFDRHHCIPSGKNELEATSHNEGWDENVLRIGGRSIRLAEARASLEFEDLRLEEAELSICL
jgi:hypothetical protein